MVLKFGHFINYIRHTLKVLKCNAGEEWRLSIGPIIKSMKKYYTRQRRKGTSYIQTKERRLTGLVIYCIGTAF
jgi:hypothetical protein